MYRKQFSMLALEEPEVGLSQEEQTLLEFYRQEYERIVNNGVCVGDIQYYESQYPGLIRSNLPAYLFTIEPSELYKPEVLTDFSLAIEKLELKQSGM